MRLLPAFGIALTFAATAVGAEPPVAAKVSFFKDVRPIFQQNCQGCHQPAKAQGGYIMTGFASVAKPGESGKPAVVPGKPDASYLVAEIVFADGHHEMPKDRPPLKPAEIETIIKWVAQGAANDTPANAVEPAISARQPAQVRRPAGRHVDRLLA